MLKTIIEENINLGQLFKSSNKELSSAITKFQKASRSRFERVSNFQEGQFKKQEDIQTKYFDKLEQLQEKQYKYQDDINKQISLNLNLLGDNLSQLFEKFTQNLSEQLEKINFSNTLAKFFKYQNQIVEAQRKEIDDRLKNILSSMALYQTEVDAHNKNIRLLTDNILRDSIDKSNKFHERVNSQLETATSEIVEKFKNINPHKEIEFVTSLIAKELAKSAKSVIDPLNEFGGTLEKTTENLNKTINSQMED